MRRALVAVAVIAAAVGLAGCAEVATPVVSPTPAVKNLDTGDLKHPIGAFADLTGFSCAAEGVTWVARGTLVNAEKSAQVYYVSVAVIQREGSGVVGSAWTKVTVKPGSAKHFTLAKVAKSSARNLQCVPRVVRAKA